MSTTGPLPVDEHWRLSVGHTTIEPEGTTKQVGPDRSGNSMWSGPRPTSKGTTGLMFIVERTSDTSPPPRDRLGMSRVDGCPECVLNVEPPTASTPLRGGGYRNLYTCGDCGFTWETEWGS